MNKSKGIHLPYKCHLMLIRENAMEIYLGRIASMGLVLAVYLYSGMVSGGEYNTGSSGNVAIKGYDPVAYFTERRALKGSEDIAQIWFGVEWNFSSEKHKRLFSENPIKYAPQYGGYCADGIAYGALVTDIDPTAWRIIEGKLYLNADHEAAVEIEEIEGQLTRAEKNWPKVKARLLSNSD